MVSVITKPIEYEIVEDDNGFKKVCFEWQGFFVTTSYCETGEEMEHELKGMLNSYWYQHQEVAEWIEFAIDFIIPVIF